MLLSRQSFPVVYSHNPTTACQGGAYSAHVTIGANPSASKAHGRLRPRRPQRDLHVHRATSTFALEPLLVPTVLSARATPSALGPSRRPGARERHGQERQLPASSCCCRTSPSPSSTRTTRRRRARAGPTRRTSLSGPTRAPTKRTVAFVLVARNGTYTSSGYFYVSLVASPTPLPYPPPPPTPAGPSSYPAGVTGYDVSWPQCTSRTSAQTKPLPGAPTYAIVGVNNGTIGDVEQLLCGRGGVGRQEPFRLHNPPAGARAEGRSRSNRPGPRRPAAATNSECEGYDWGYNYAETDIAFVKAQGADPKVWWVDVETAEGWPTSPAFQPVNAAIIQGALAAIKQAGDIGRDLLHLVPMGQDNGLLHTSGGRRLCGSPARPSLSDGYYSAQSYCQRALSPGDPSTLEVRGRSASPAACPGSCSMATQGMHQLT